MYVSVRVVRVVCVRNLNSEVDAKKASERKKVVEWGAADIKVWLKGAGLGDIDCGRIQAPFPSGGAVLSFAAFAAKATPDAAVELISRVVPSLCTVSVMIFGGALNTLHADTH